MIRNKVTKGIYERSKREKKEKRRLRGEGGILPVWQDAVPPPSPVLHSGTSSENSAKVVFTLKISKILRGTQSFLVVFAKSLNLVLHNCVQVPCLWTSKVSVRFPKNDKSTREKGRKNREQQQKFQPYSYITGSMTSIYQVQYLHK